MSKLIWRHRCPGKLKPTVMLSKAKMPENMDTMIHMPSERERVLKAWHLVEAYFKGDGQKANLWFKTKNPALGDVSPYWMIYVGRIDKLLKFIESQLEGNRP